MLRFVEKSWADFWAYYWRVESRRSIPGIFEWDIRLVEFIEHVCELEPGQRILDLGCGGGDQLKLFAKKGYRVVGIDIAPPLVAYARRQLESEGLEGEVIVGDMRAIRYRSTFDACLILSGSFGFFREDEDRKLLRSISRALKRGGRTFIMFVSPHRRPEIVRSWSKAGDGWELRETWFDCESSTYRSRIMLIQGDGKVLIPAREPGYHANEVIRCYSVPEMKRMLSDVGLAFQSAHAAGDIAVPVQSSEPHTVRDIIVARKA